MNIYQSVTDLIGHTPMVRINRIIPHTANVVAKIESVNPASSVKDRVAAAIIDDAEASGKLQPGGTIVEATSGNTGVGLAMVGAARGYHVVITMPESMSEERRSLMRAFGAELILTPAAQGMQGTIDAAKKIIDERPDAIWARQFDNQANPRTHEVTTAEEIWADTDGKVDIFVAGIGTGGTISGVGKALKAKNPNIRIVGVEPAESPLLSQGKAGPHGIQGIGANFIPGNYDGSVVDELIQVTSDNAMKMARRSAREEGLFVGISSGAALWAAAELASRPELESKMIVALLPDTGERYLSTALFNNGGGSDTQADNGGKPASGGK